AAVVDTSRWELVRFSLHAEEAPDEVDGEVFQCGKSFVIALRSVFRIEIRREPCCASVRGHHVELSQTDRLDCRACDGVVSAQVLLQLTNHRDDHVQTSHTGRSRSIRCRQSAVCDLLDMIKELIHPFHPIR
ncbi:hypothetical protein ABTX71_36450, partial [Streptomyces parvulus]